jgi:hypothetical protein
MINALIVNSSLTYAKHADNNIKLILMVFATKILLINVIYMDLLGNVLVVRFPIICRVMLVLNLLLDVCLRVLIINVVSAGLAELWSMETAVES